MRRHTPVSYTHLDVYKRQAQTRQTIQNPSGVQVGCFTSMAPTYLINAEDRAAGYDIIAPLTQEDGTGYSVYAASIPTNSFFITKNCQNPEAAFRLGDIMMSEEMSIWNRFGKKGTDWLEPEAGEHGMFAVSYTHLAALE